MVNLDEDLARVRERLHLREEDWDRTPTQGDGEIGKLDGKDEGMRFRGSEDEEQVVLKSSHLLLSVFYDCFFVAFIFFLPSSH